MIVDLFFFRFFLCYFETFLTFVYAPFLTNNHRFSAYSFPSKLTIIRTIFFHFILDRWMFFFRTNAKYAHSQFFLQVFTRFFFFREIKQWLIFFKLPVGDHCYEEKRDDLLQVKNNGQTSIKTTVELRSIYSIWIEVLCP